MSNLATILSHLMLAKNIKSAELARRTGIGQPVIHRLMTGVTENPQILTLKPLSDFFGVSIEQLIGLTPLNQRKMIDETTLHQLNNKLSAIKTVAGVLTDLLPTLIEGYQKAIEAHLITASIPKDILPLLSLNTTNLLNATHQAQTLLTHNNENQDIV
ncbi:MAG: helix-turn-helix transcriptional regulator [Gammaproteobacteria bacterium]|nr:helix-turn-helix transcriptional regulator [Gammaproteobacteria bacterium]